jgi:aminopeptidase YwaD
VGTTGNAEAARFVAERFRVLGLAPAWPDGYLQRFEAPVRAALAGENALVLAGTAAQTWRDWQPFTFSESGAVEGELVWAGYGITAPALGWDDYAGVDVKGKVVVVAAHFPREDDPASPFRDPTGFQYGEWRYKAMNARDHGAAALVAVRDDWHHPGKDELPPWKGSVSSRAGIVAAQATLATLERAGVRVRALAAATDEQRRPQSGPLGVRARLAVGVEQENAPAANVVALLPGRGEKAGECVVVGAHYDHLGHGGETSLAPDRTGEVHPGADDNASGVAALLEIARAFAAEGPRERTILFAAFSGEELGLLGSAQLVRSPPAACPVERMQLMVNLDMVGRPQGGKVYVHGAATAKGLQERVAALAGAAAPLQLVWGAGDGYGPSDHTSFYAKGVPVLFLFTGAHPDYHRPTDTADKVDAAGLVAVARLAHRAAHEAAEGPRLEVVRELAPAPGKREERGYGAYLGTVPDFAERKDPGVLVSAVRTGSPAEKAGIAAGDVLLGLGTAKIVSLKDLGYALRMYRPGDVVEVTFARDGATRAAKVTLEERK